ncbi:MULTISPECIES: serine hydrolase domain-containing protein [Chitinophagaceae]
MSYRYSLLLLFLVLNMVKAHAQSAYKASYEELKTFQGTYAMAGGGTLQIAASPKDTMLYALVGDARYKLRPYAKHVFLNNGNQQVEFVIRDGKIAGYKVSDQHPDQLYPLITKTVTFSDKMWYARQPGGNYRYHIPTDRHDGLAVGSAARAGLDTGLLRALVNRIIGGEYANVHSVLIVKDGRLVFEEYFYEYDAETLHQLRSASKTFTSALIGLALGKRLIKSVNEPVIRYFPQYKPGNMDAQKASITIENMLTQQSGLDCNDFDAHSTGNETKIYPTDDWIKTVLDLPMAYTPGTGGMYCSGNTMVLGKIVEQVSHQPLHQFAAENLFGKLGVKRFKWDFVPDKSHQEDFGQLYLAPRDMAKFGLLYLNGGKWEGKQIINRDYVARSLKKHSVIDGIDYGYLWWCEDLTANGVKYTGMAAKGNGGQRIFIWPGLNMVAVVTAGNYNEQSPANKLLIECVLGGLKK